MTLTLASVETQKFCMQPPTLTFSKENDSESKTTSTKEHDLTLNNPLKAHLDQDELK